MIDDILPLNLLHLNLKHYPSKNFNNKNNKFTLTIGDLHGNALLLIYYLQLFNVIRISKKNYTTLAELYYGHEKFLQDRVPFEKLKAHIEKFHQLCQAIKWNNQQKIFIRLIGDELCDRGANDYFMIFLIAEMAKFGVEFRILMSNHGVNFLGSVFNDIYKTMGSTIDDDYCRSYENLKKLYFKYKEHGESLFPQELDTWLANVYLPRLLLIDYEFNSKTEMLSIYTHAPQGLAKIRELFDLFDLEFNAQSTLAIATSIIAFQAHFQQFFSHNREEIIKMFQTEKTPLREFVWNRQVVQASNLPINFIHGHHRYNNPEPQFTSLDDAFGKGHVYEVKSSTQLMISKDSSLCRSYASILQTKIMKHLNTNPEKCNHLQLLQRGLILVQKTLELNDLNLITESIYNLKACIAEIKPKLSTSSIFSKLNWFLPKNQQSSIELCEQIESGIQLLESAFTQKN